MTWDGGGNRTAAASLPVRRRCAAVFPPAGAVPDAAFALWKPDERPARRR